MCACLVTVVTRSCTGAKPALSFEAFDTLFDVEDRVKIHSIKGEKSVFLAVKNACIVKPDVRLNSFHGHKRGYYTACLRKTQVKCP